jgi:hypothetical protein
MWEIYMAMGVAFEERQDFVGNGNANEREQLHRVAGCISTEVQLL